MAAPTLSSKRSNLRGIISLSRPRNLAIAAFTLCLIRYGWMARWPLQEGALVTTPIQIFEATLVMLLLMAAGNIINAYFDVQEDRINRPERAIVDRTVKRRVLIFTHQVLNLLGLALACHLSWSIGSAGPFLMAALVSWILWRYSASWKAKPLIGNAAIAMLLGLVPLWLAVMEAPNASPQMQLNLIQNLGAYGLMAMAIGMVREIAKDAMDIEGDGAAGKATFALKYGTAKTRWLCIALWTLVAVMYAGGVLRWGHISEPAAWATWAAPFPGWVYCLWLMMRAVPNWKVLSRATLATLILGIVQCLWVPMI